MGVSHTYQAGRCPAGVFVSIRIATPLPAVLNDITQQLYLDALGGSNSWLKAFPDGRGDDTAYFVPWQCQVSEDNL